ncbi:MAG: hypothetical protein ABEJ24_05815 [Candidatus Magasanikbacteria bacterium]
MSPSTSEGSSDPRDKSREELMQEGYYDQVSPEDTGDDSETSTNNNPDQAEADSNTDEEESQSRDEKEKVEAED